MGHPGTHRLRAAPGRHRQQAAPSGHLPVRRLPAGRTPGHPGAPCPPRLREEGSQHLETA
eukprot:11206084-Lingulodinium_polyedra.AAC.1